MKSERRITVLGLIINIIIMGLKLFGGLVFNSYTTLVSSYETLVKMVEDFISFSGSVARGRRLSSKVPLGFGKKEMISQILFGVILLALATFLLIKSFFLKYRPTDLRIVLVIIIIGLVEYVYSKYLFKRAKENQSEMLMAISHKSFYASLFSNTSLFFVILSAWMPIFDMFGCIVGSIIIFYQAFTIIKDNYMYLKGQNDRNAKVIKEIKKIINDSKAVKYVECDLINVRTFYKAIIQIEIKEDISISKLIWLEIYLKEKIYMRVELISDIDFLVTVLE